MNIIETIKARKSWRTFEEKEIEESKLAALKESLKDTKTLFNTPVRFELIDMDEIEKGQRKMLGTYGVIQGARFYIAGAAAKAPHMLTDFGYAFEKIILNAAGLGLGTCWIGATMEREGFSKKMGIKENEELVAITPLGYNKPRRRIKDLAMRKFVNSDARKDFNLMFFSGECGQELSREEAGRYFECLEMVRLAPSASNQQPWIIIKEKGEGTFHLYLNRTENYKYRNLQSVDTGIAASHFELSALELGLKGKWEAKEPQIPKGNMEYIVSWIGE